MSHPVILLLICHSLYIHLSSRVHLRVVWVMCRMYIRIMSQWCHHWRIHCSRLVIIRNRPWRLNWAKGKIWKAGKRRNQCHTHTHKGLIVASPPPLCLSPFFEDSTVCPCDWMGGPEYVMGWWWKNGCKVSIKDHSLPLATLTDTTNW